VAKAVLNLPTTRMLIERVEADKTLRRLCGWSRLSEVPSESTFSRAFAEFAESELPSRVPAILKVRNFKFLGFANQPKSDSRLGCSSCPPFCPA
jgi:hypothetical protein